MLRHLIFALSGILVLLAGCGSIITNVSVLKPSYLDGIKMEQMKYAELRAAYEQDQTFIENRYKADIEKLDETYRRLANEYGKKAATLKTDDPSRTTLTIASQRWLDEAGSEGEFNKILQNRIQKIIEWNEKTRIEVSREANYISVLRGDAPIPSKVVTILNNQRFERESLGSLIEGQRKNLNKALRADENLNVKEKKQSSQEIDKRFSSMEQTTLLTLGGWKAIHEDPVAYSVASAKEEMWAIRYNDVKGFGLFGNTDFIIVLDKRGNFRMKGISFDPSKVAEMASKVTTQALIAAVSISGVPVPKGSAANSNSGEKQAMANSNDALLAKQNALNTIENQYVNYRRALIDIAKSIVEKKDDLNDKAKYAAATTAIKQTFNAHKTRLTLSQESNNQ